MKHTKKLAAVIMAATMTLTMIPMTASADEWVSVNNGYKYQLDNGSYAKKGWLTVDGQKYYIKSNGFRAKGMIKITETVNKKKTTNYYYFNDEGVMQTGWQEISGKKYYFRTSNGTRVTNKKIVIGSYSYKFDKNGKWTGIVYSKDGKKNVTKKVDVDKLTSNTTKAATTTSNKTTTSTSKKVSGEIPKTVTINGQVLNTSATNKFVGTKADAIYPKGKDEGNQRYERGNRWAIDISGCTDKDLEVLKYFSNLDNIFLVDHDNTSKITNLDFCQYMPKLKRIYVQGAVNLTDVSGLGACKNLQYIEIGNCKLTNLDGLENLKNVKKVNIAYTWLDNLDGLVNCTKLEEVTVNDGRLTDISALANKNNLTFVELNVNRRLKDITALTKCANLEELYLNGCTSVNTWKALTAMTSLKKVAICYNVLGSKGPYEYATKLENKGVAVAVDGNAMYFGDGGLHNGEKELGVDREWDAKYRPTNVRGDDAKCEANCGGCASTAKDAYKCLI